MIATAPRARAVILLEPLGLLTLLEIEGVGFTFYSSSERVTIHVEDTDDGFTGEVELRGQTEPRSALSFLAVSQMPDPETGGARSEYRLERIDVPEPSSLALAALGIVFSLRRGRRARRLLPVSGRATRRRQF